MRTLMIVLFVAATGCVPGNNPLRVEGVFGIDPMTCKVDDSVEIYRGLLDASGDGAYVLAFRVQSNLAAPELTNGHLDVVSDPESNNFVAEELILQYKSTDPVISFETEHVSVFFAVKPGEKADVVANIVGSKAAQKLRDNITDPAADPKTTLNVTVTVKGHLDSGQQLAVNPFTYPLTVYTSGKSCTNGFAPVACGVGSGQDGNPATCL